MARKKGKGYITFRQVQLDRHDEDKVLLFAAGIVFGIGASSYLIRGETVFTGLTLIVLGLILAFIEAREWEAKN
jgi:hypothetical protein